MLAMILLNGLLQLVGVTSIFPFFALAADPDRIRRSSLGEKLLSILPPMDTNQLLVAAGCFAIVMLFASSLGGMLSEVFRLKYTYNFSQWLREQLFNSYSNQPYSFFLKRNSAQLTQRVWDIGIFTTSVLIPIGEVLSRIIIVFFLLGGFFLVQPKIAIGAFILFGGFYFLVFTWIRPRTKLIGDKLQNHSYLFGKNTNQFLHGIKTVFVSGKRSFFIKKALYHSNELGRVGLKVPIYGNGPRYLIEPVAFGGLVTIVVVMALKGNPFSDILPNLSVMAMAGYRLLPSLQMMYGQLVNIASNSYTLRQLEEEILEIENESSSDIKFESSNNVKIQLNKQIEFKSVSFNYSNTVPPTINKLSLIILKNESLGIAGPSGSGKSTLVDLLLGLHSPIAGQILVDGVPLTHANMASWRSIIGYVPQDIYLIDETIAANIAFGIDVDAIDQMALREAAQGAQILDFIEKDLPQEFKTIVGERGVRLSGGQRQRIGLARALYHKPKILILDEATSALDHQTEAAVMETIHELQGKLTIITIAHRLSTLERCDRIITLSR